MRRALFTVGLALSAVVSIFRGRAAFAETAPPTQAPVEVTVEGEKAPPGSTSLRRRDIHEMPGVLDDPYRAIEVEPGVLPSASGFPYYFIRGAPPGNIGYFFDGIQLPLLFHVGGGPSVLPSAMIRRVELHPGPYPANVGRFAGAIVEADSTPPPSSWRGMASLRATDAGGFIEGPARDDIDVLVGGRYSAGAALVSALVPSIAIQYGDYQARVAWRPTPGTRLSVLAFGARDYLAAALTSGGSKDVLLNSDFHRTELRFERETDRGDKILAAVTLGLDRSRDIGVTSARDLKLGGRVSVTHPFGEQGGMLRAGLDAGLDRYDVTPHAEQCPPADKDATQAHLECAFKELFPSRLDFVVGGFVDAIVPLGGRSTLRPGLRVDHYTSLGNTAVAIDPKLVGKFAVGEHVHLVPAVAIASQPPGFAPLPALAIGGLPGGLQRSLQTSFGAEVRVGPIEGVTTVFRQATFNLTDAVGTGRGGGLDKERFLTRSLGDAYGLELGARGALRKDMFFVASYTLSRATRAMNGRTRGGPIPSAYDRTHVAQVALLFDLGHNIRMGFRHVFYTGFPADEFSDTGTPKEHPDRVRPFYRLDARVSKRWKVGARGYLELALDLQNATLSKEVFDVKCSAKECTPRIIGPLTIPSLALEAGF